MQQRHRQTAVDGGGRQSAQNGEYNTQNTTQKST